MAVIVLPSLFSLTSPGRTIFWALIMYTLSHLYYNTSVAKESGNFKSSRLTRLDRLLNDLTLALTEQKEYLDRHTAAMVKLAQAIKQLESTIKKEGSLESQKTLSLIDLIRVFVEYEINPRYYEAHHRTMLKASGDSRHIDLGRRKLTGPPEKPDGHETARP